MKILLIITLLIFTSHAAYSETKWIGEITEEICTDEQYMIRAKIASSCIMDEQVFLILAWGIHDGMAKEFKSNRPNRMESFMESFLMLSYLNDHSNYKSESVQRLTIDNKALKDIFNVCQEKPAQIIRCKNEVELVIKYSKFKPYEYNYRHKKSKYIKCSDATEQRHIEECRK